MWDTSPTLITRDKPEIVNFSVSEFPTNEYGELFYRSLVQSLPSAIAAADNQGRQLFVNPAFCRLTGWSEEELLGQSIPFCYVPVEDASEFIDNFRRIHADPKTIAATNAIVRFCSKDGERFLVRVRLAPLLVTGEVIGSMASFDDLRRVSELGPVLQSRETLFENVVRGCQRSFIFLTFAKK